MKDFPLIILLLLLACSPTSSTETNTTLEQDEKAPIEADALSEDEQNSKVSAQEKVPVVYVTADGDKYHTADCRFSKTANETKLSQAKSDGKTACGICKPNSTTGEKQIRCSANTAEGSQCKRMTVDASGKCFQHRDS